MATENLDSLVYLKFAFDYGMDVMKYYGAPCTLPINIAMKFDFSNVQGVLTKLISVATLRRSVLICMNKQLDCSLRMECLLKLAPYTALLALKRHIRSVVVDDKYSLFFVCAMTAKICHMYIQANLTRMVFIPLIALADVIYEDKMAPTLQDWEDLNDTAKQLLLVNEIQEDAIVRKESKASNFDESTFWWQD